jgi:hypothetical protein
MRFSQALRPFAGAAVVGCLFTGAACQGPVARRLDARRQSPVTTAPAVATPAATTAPPSAAPPSGQAVRTDDLEAGLQRADGQLSQTGSAVSDADQPSQQSND